MLPIGQALWLKELQSYIADCASERPEERDQRHAHEKHNQ